MSYISMGDLGVATPEEQARDLEAGARMMDENARHLDPVNSPQSRRQATDFRAIALRMRGEASEIRARIAAGREPTTAQLQTAQQTMDAGADALTTAVGVMPRAMGLNLTAAVNNMRTSAASARGKLTARGVTPRPAGTLGGTILKGGAVLGAGALAVLGLRRILAPGR